MPRRRPSSRRRAGQWRPSSGSRWRLGYATQIRRSWPTSAGTGSCRGRTSGILGPGQSCSRRWACGRPARDAGRAGGQHVLQGRSARDQSRRGRGTCWTTATAASPDVVFASVTDAFRRGVKVTNAVEVSVGEPGSPAVNVDTTCDVPRPPKAPFEAATSACSARASRRPRRPSPRWWSSARRRSAAAWLTTSRSWPTSPPPSTPSPRTAQAPGARSAL